MAARTTSISLSTSAWTLVADQTAGDTSALLQQETSGAFLVHGAASAPADPSNVGVTVNDGGNPFAATLASGQKLYAKAKGSALSITAMVG